MVNIMNLVQVRNKVQKNGFDLSHKNGFTAKAGEILPFLSLYTLPNSEYEINLSSFTRTMPLNTAAFVRIREYYDFYFVPLRLLWRYAPQVFAQTNEQNFATASSGDTYVGDQFPFINTFNLYKYWSEAKKLASSKDNSIRKKSVDVLNYYFHFGFGKLMSYLDYGDISQFGGDASLHQPVNLFKLFAYQKIYMDYFRNSQWESVNPQSFNVDYIKPGDGINFNTFTVEQFIKNFQLRYCNYPADMFTGLLPNTQYGDLATVHTSPISNQEESYYGYNFVNKDKEPLARYAETASRGAGILDGEIYDFDSNEKGEYIRLINAGLANNGSFNILQLRKAEALQRYNEVSQTWQKDYPSQMAAHYGSNTSQALGLRCTYLGGVDDTIQIGDVVNTNLSQWYDTSADEYYEGDTTIKGKGTGISNGKIHFKSEEHGIIMGVYHALPLLDYVADGCDEMNFKTEVTDFAIPEFDSVGMQPVYGRSLLYDPAHYSNFATSILGYAPRYIEYKTAVDKVHGAFINGGMEAWYVALNNSMVTDKIVSDALNIFKLQKVNPNIFNSIFSVQVLPGYGNIEISPEQKNFYTSSDNLMINCFMDIKAVLPLDRNGLPY